jgi:hypothetical protein
LQLIDQNKIQSVRNAGEFLSLLQKRISGNERQLYPAMSGVWQHPYPDIPAFLYFISSSPYNPILLPLLMATKKLRKWFCVNNLPFPVASFPSAVGHPSRRAVYIPSSSETPSIFIYGELVE